eukprot:6374887-Pyramimonas_sp.AAC.1
MDRLHNKTRLLNGSWIGNESTPMAKQYLEDLEQLAQTDENMRGWWERRRSDLHILTWGTEEWHQWINIDPAILRSAATHWKDATEEVNEKEGEEHITKPYWCDH